MRVKESESNAKGSHNSYLDNKSSVIHDVIDKLIKSDHSVIISCRMSRPGCNRRAENKMD